MPPCIICSGMNTSRNKCTIWFLRAGRTKTNLVAQRIFWFLRVSAKTKLLAQSLERLGHFEDARQAYRDGLAASLRHNHQPLIDDYTQALKDLPE